MFQSRLQGHCWLPQASARAGFSCFLHSWILKIPLLLDDHWAWTSNYIHRRGWCVPQCPIWQEEMCFINVHCLTGDMPNPWHTNYLCPVSILYTASSNTYPPQDGVMCVDTWHMVTKPLQSQRRKGENTGVSYGKGTSRLLAEVAALTLQHWQKGNKTVYLAWVRHISLDSVGRILIIVIPPCSELLAEFRHLCPRQLSKLSQMHSFNDCVSVMRQSIWHTQTHTEPSAYQSSGLLAALSVWWLSMKNACCPSSPKPGDWTSVCGIWVSPG